MARRPRAKGPVAVIAALLGLGGLGAWCERSGWVYVWFPSLLPPALTTDGLAPVISVRDGDTIDIRYYDMCLPIRLRCVDTAESVHKDATRNTAFGSEAAAMAKQRLTGATVRIEFSRRGAYIATDQYGRALADVWLGDELFNATLVREGWSKYETGYGASERYHDVMVAAEAEARQARRGVWRTSK